MEKTITNSLVGSKMRAFLSGVHHVLLVIHLIIMIVHSLKTGVFSLEFWLTLIVNVLLLLDLERITMKLITLIQYKKINSS